MTFTLANASGKRFMHHCDLYTYLEYVKPGEQPKGAGDLQISTLLESHIIKVVDVGTPKMLGHQFPKNDPNVLKPMTSHNKTILNSSWPARVVEYSWFNAPNSCGFYSKNAKCHGFFCPYTTELVIAAFPFAYL